jgi:hypothetical protein
MEKRLKYNYGILLDKTGLEQLQEHIIKAHQALSWYLINLHRHTQLQTGKHLIILNLG